MFLFVSLFVCLNVEDTLFLVCLFVNGVLPVTGLKV